MHWYVYLELNVLYWLFDTQLRHIYHVELLMHSIDDMDCTLRRIGIEHVPSMLCCTLHSAEVMQASAHSTLHNDMCNYSLSFLFVIWPSFTNTNVSVFRKKKNQDDMYILWDHSFNFFSGNGPCVASPSHFALPSYPLMCLLSLPNKGIKMAKLYIYIFF